MLIEGWLLLPDGPSRLRPTLGQVRLEGGRIAEVATDRRIGTADLGSDRSLVSPGLIDAHLHLPQFDVIGFDGLPLLEWLRTAVFPAEAKWADAAFAADMGGRVAARLLAAGTTGIAAYATVHHDGTRAAMEALGRAGLRGCVGQVLMDQQAPGELCRPAAQLLKEAVQIEAVGRIEPAITPRFAVSCSRELLEGAGALARAKGWAVQTHLSETRDEVELVRRLHGAGYLEVYERSGLVSKRTIFGHCIWMEPDELKRMRESGCVAAHCPTANLFLQAGQMDLARSAGAGVRIAVGSDVAGGPDVCMVRVARAVVETAKRVRMLEPRSPLVSAAEAWWRITGGNAEALGWGDAGRLSTGASADLVIIDPTRGPNAEPGWMHAPDPLSKVLYAWDERWIARTIVQGRAA